LSGIARRRSTLPGRAVGGARPARLDPARRHHPRGGRRGSRVRPGDRSGQRAPLAPVGGRRL